MTVSKNQIAAYKVGVTDSVEDRITHIYHTHGNHWIVYKTKDVQYEIADDLAQDHPELLQDYRSRIETIQDLRAEVQRLLQEARDKTAYEPSIANAIAMALRGNSPAARRLLETTIQDLEADFQAVTRQKYFKFTAIGTIIGLSIAGALAAFVLTPAYEFHLMWLAGTAGLVGAAFSIVLAIHARAVGSDRDVKALATDSVTRLIIGFISGGFIELLLESGVLPKIIIGTATFEQGTVTWRTAIAVGFVAGFLERMVPNLLHHGRAENVLGKPAVPSHRWRQRVEKPAQPHGAAAGNHKQLHAR